MMLPHPNPSSGTASDPAPTLPQEIVVYILNLSAQTIPFRTSINTSAYSKHSTSHPPFSQTQLAKLCLLSHNYNSIFTKELYRTVWLANHHALSCFRTTLAENQQLGTLVRHLAILNNLDIRPQRLDPLGTLAVPRADVGSLPSETDPTQASTGQIIRPTSTANPKADLILEVCPNLTHLLLSRNDFTDWTRGFEKLTLPREITLMDTAMSADFNGLARRHRDNMTRALGQDPRFRAILAPSSSFNDASVAAQSGTSAAANDPPTDAEQLQTHDTMSSSPLASAETSNRPSVRMPSYIYSPTHLHLINFDGRLIHHLAQIISLTHVVLTYPLLPEVAPGAPGLTVIPRSHLMLLLGSGRIRKIVIRAHLKDCIRIIQEVMPIEDQKLVFRPIQSKNERGRIQDSSESCNSVDTNDSQPVAELDVLREFWERVHLDTLRRRSLHAPPSTLSSDYTSLGSSEIEDDSSRSSLGGNSSGSFDSLSNTDEEGYDSEDDYNSGNPHALDQQLLNQARRQQDQDRLVRATGLTAAFTDVSRLSFLTTTTAAATTATTTPYSSSQPQPQPAIAGPSFLSSPTAPPPQIPIEELLRYETLSRRVTTATNDRSSPLEPRSRPRRGGPFASKKYDLCGATQQCLNQCRQLLVEDEQVRFW